MILTDNEIMLGNLMEMACGLMSCNAEIHRIEDTVKRIGVAYGAEDMNVFAITSSIIVTMIMPDGSKYTETRRIQNPSGFHFSRLIQLNALSREYCSEPMTPQKLEKRLAEIAEGKYTDPNNRFLFHMNANVHNVAGSMLIAGSFALFYGGTVYDAIAGIFCGFLCYLIQQLIRRKAPNQLIFQLLNALGIGLVIEIMGTLIPFLHQDKIMIGVIMLLIPGMAMTNALKDILTGDTISGALRLLETIIWAGALAAGFMVAMTIMSGHAYVYHGETVNFFLHLFLAFLGSWGFAMTFYMPGRYLFYTSLGGAICWAMYLLGVNYLGMSVFGASILGTVVSAVYAELKARKMQIPATIMLIPAFIPLVPGSSLYYTMWAAVTQNPTEMKSYALSTLLCALGMALGMSVVFAFYDMYIFNRKR